MISRLSVLILGLLLAALAVAQTAPVLRPGDVIKVVCEEMTGSGDYPLDRFGNANIAFIGKVNLAGLTEIEAAAMIAKQLETKGIAARATVTVKLLASKDAPILYTGAVEKGGEIAPRKGLKLSDLIPIAQPTSAADMKKIRITSRDGLVLVVNHAAGGEGSNPELRSGDQVYFPLVDRAQEVYVLGGVARPGRLPFKGSLNTKEALEAVGGVLPHANSWRARITKPNGEEWPLDLSEDGREIQLEPGDVITVPLVDKQRFVTVSGAVVRPGPVELRFGMAWEQAIEAAGGYLVDADPARVTVKRMRDKGEKVIITTPLEPYDFVEVPFRRGKGSPAIEAALRVFSILSVIGR
jgi:protein involved in polysaccharide export with SLBB domain